MECTRWALFLPLLLYRQLTLLAATGSPQRHGPRRCSQGQPRQLSTRFCSSMLTTVLLQVIDLDTPDDDITEIQKEVALLSEMRDANRHNITLYHGCYLHNYELWIAMDFASGGSIRTLVS